MAGILLRNDSEAIPVEQNEGPSTSRQTQDTGNASELALVRARREQVSVACIACRRRKVKVR
jgi:hypothetical protein